jgi:hypothetical protein
MLKGDPGRPPSKKVRGVNGAPAPRPWRSRPARHNYEVMAMPRRGKSDGEEYW